MKLIAVSMLALIAGSGLAPAASAEHWCEDAPYLPGAVSQFYDMWNNIYRHYRCSYIEKFIQGEHGSEGIALVVLP